jgi:ribosomal protein L11 methyltransferase
MTNISKPPENLVIYEVSGEWPGEDHPDAGPGFLGFWIESGYTFFFFDREAAQVMDVLIAARPGMEIRQVHHMTYAQWQDGAKFRPFRIGPLTFAPIWNDPPFEPGPATIVIDPGLAFGFGGHPTTSACLAALERVYLENKPAEVLDLGAGTGVLSFAAIRLGAERALAVEYSHLGAENAMRNAELNGLGDRVRVVRGRAEDYCTEPAGLVCSNLHFQVQETVLNKGGFSGRDWLVLSGLFHRQGEIMEERLVELGYRLVDRVRDERWTTLLMKAIRERKP